MLEKIAKFRWESLFNDEKHENELKVEILKRTRFLNQRNQLKNQINNYLNAERDYLDAGRAMADQLEDLKIKLLMKGMMQINNTELLKNPLQNIKRKKTGLEQQEYIQKRVKDLIYG